MSEPAATYAERRTARVHRRARWAGWREAAGSPPTGADLRGGVAGWLFLIGCALILIGMALARWDVRPGLEGVRPLRDNQAPGLLGRVASWPPPLERRPG